MNRKLSSISILVMIAMVLDSCFYDKEDAIYPLKGFANPCDSVATYNQCVKFIMANNCTSCHNTNHTSGGVSLDNYNDVMRVAKNGSLMGTIESQPGYNTMPPGGVQLSSCQVSKLNDWINAQEPQ